MKIYKILLNFDFAYPDIVVNENQHVEVDFNSLEIPPETEVDWFGEDDLPLPDISILYFKFLMANHKSIEKLKCFVIDGHFEKTNLGDEEYYIFTHLKTMKNVLNLKASKVSYFSTGDIKEIERPVFLPGEYPDIFWIEEVPSAIFCTQSFYARIEENGLKGLTFEECKIKSKSWFIL